MVITRVMAALLCCTILTQAADRRHEYLDELQLKMNKIGAGIHETFFALKTPGSFNKSGMSQSQTQ